MATFQPKNPNASEFRKALNKLASDPAYRAAALKDPTHITNDFKLTLVDLQALREAAVMSGADVTEVNKLRSHAIAANVSGNLSQLSPGIQSAFGAQTNLMSVDVSCCSCCCCCCGETGIAPVILTMV